MKKVMAAVLFILAVALVFFFILGKNKASPLLLLKDAESGKVFASYELPQGEFGVSFIHSVNKTQVLEIYKVEGNEIYLEGCIYYSFGAGVAEELPEGWELKLSEDGEMIISNIHKKIERLSYFVGTVSDHILHIEGKEWSLRELCGRNTKLLFELG